MFGGSGQYLNVDSVANFVMLMQQAHDAEFVNPFGLWSVEKYIALKDFLWTVEPARAGGPLLEAQKVLEFFRNPSVTGG